MWTAALMLAVSCGGGGTVSGPVDLSPWMGADSVYTFTVKDVTFTLTPVKAGTFAMGETLDMGRFRTPALHQVILDGYAIGTTEVTQALWKAVMGSNPSPKDVPTAPVTMVSYGDAQKFLQKLSKATGVPFRLPTEAEWEYAARQREGMAGGAWEWCSDRWTDDLGALLTVNPQGPEDGAEYALRGGSALEKNNKAITRKPMAPTTKAGDVGLRLAVSTGEAFPQELYEVLVENKVPRERYKITELKPETFTVNGVNFEMLPVEGGTFLMGGTEQKGQVIREDELPQHEVTLDHFKIGKLEVTQALWEAVMGEVPYGTEAEWEYAARGGKKTRGYNFAGSPFPQVVAQFGYEDMRTRPVARYSPNELGTYDMSGNAWEWCQDRVGPYTSIEQRDPTGPASVRENDQMDPRIMRGGSVATTQDKCRVSNRGEFDPNRFRTTIGFRLAL